MAQPAQRSKLAAILIADGGEYSLLLMGVDEAVRVCALEASATRTAVDAESILCARGGKRHGALGARA